jgi:tetratricopeptide (TPR) repeat protein
MNEAKVKFPLILPVLLLFVLICIIYSNTLDNPWFFDDYYNIVQNPKVQLTQLTRENLTRALYASPTQKRLYRPFAYLTFALNWYFGKDSVRGYHLVNIVIHMLAAGFLFFTILLLFKTRPLKDCDSETIYFVALLSSAIWAIHPIQIQAVTYIVQRMASMAAMFYILAIFSFLKARLSRSSASRLIYICICGISYLLGVWSKNNAILLPISLILMEFIFFRDLAQRSTQIRATVWVVVVAMLIAAAGFFFFIQDTSNPLLKGYELRPFTMAERLLTQPRVLFFYLSQLFYPTANRFSVVHDFTFSTSLLTPWTTLPAILFILVLTGLAIWRIKKNPLFSFAILFYFGNHVIESSILPLEMVFEHRNYLPSFFLFVPISYGVKKVIDYYCTTNKPMYAFLSISLCVAIVSIGSSTYIRNMDWQSKKSLWEAAMRKAPRSPRPLQSLAWGYYMKTGRFDTAIELLLRALELKCDTTTGCGIFSYKNLASIYFFQRHDNQKAVEYLQKISESVSKNDKSELLLSQALMRLARDEDANAVLDRLIVENPTNHTAYYLKGVISLQHASYSHAYEQFKKCIRMGSSNWRYFREIGVCLTHMGYYERGHWFLNLARNILPNDSTILLRLADNRIRAGRIDQAGEWIERLLENKNIAVFESELRGFREYDAWTPLAPATIALISEKVKNRTAQYLQSIEQIREDLSSPNSKNQE